MPRLGDVAKGAAPLLEAAEAAAKPAPRSVPCRACQAPMFFITSPSTGRLMPVDARQTTVMVPPPPECPDEPWRLVKGHVPHHITCPNAADFRRKK